LNARTTTYTVPTSRKGNSAGSSRTRASSDRPTPTATATTSAVARMVSADVRMM
jgi:hypothetical protein